jgi:hypothetical protein
MSVGQGRLSSSGEVAWDEGCRRVVACVCVCVCVCVLCVMCVCVCVCVCVLRRKVSSN